MAPPDAGRAAGRARLGGALWRLHGVLHGLAVHPDRAGRGGHVGPHPPRAALPGSPPAARARAPRLRRARALPDARRRGVLHLRGPAAGLPHLRLPRPPRRGRRPDRARQGPPRPAGAPLAVLASDRARPGRARRGPCRGRVPGRTGRRAAGRVGPGQRHAAGGAGHRDPRDLPARRPGGRGRGGRGGRVAVVAPDPRRRARGHLPSASRRHRPEPGPTCRGIRDGAGLARRSGRRRERRSTRSQLPPVTRRRCRSAWRRRCSRPDPRSRSGRRRR